MTKKPSLWQRIKDAFSPIETSPNPPNPTNDTQQSNIEDLTGQVIVDLAQHRSTSPDPTAIENSKITADDIDVMLASMGYHFTYHPPHARETAKDTHVDERPIHHFTMQVSDGERDWGCLLRYFEKEQLLAVYSIFPFSVPDSHRGEMLAVLAYLNYDLVIGNLELDIYDGEIRFKTSLDLEVTGLSAYIMAYLLQSNFSVVSRLHHTLAEVITKPMPAETASEAVDNLLLTQQASAFYLMTDSIQ